MSGDNAPPKEPHTTLPRVIVIGAGFYGLAAAKVVHDCTATASTPTNGL
jgi:hypothetical protein